ncbi:hypothetical protein HDU98_002051 [Podochytrium sp. JEL0797]|nr:hypothetical protein HDU98_002051 [Podochytrium sp. JEL0797]
MKVHTFLFALLCSIYAVSATSDPSKKSTKELLDEAKVHLASGKVNDAMQAFDLAIEQEPKNYMALFRRAAAQLSIGRMNQALRDFDTVLKLRPDFDQALIQRGKIHMKECNLSEALKDLRKYSASHPQDLDVVEVIKEAETSEQDVAVVESLIQSKQHDVALETLSRLVQACPLKMDWRVKRAEIYLELNDVVMAVGDYSRIASFKPTPPILLKLATLRLQMGELADSLASIKECMKQDPENKPCKKVFKSLKALDKSLKKVDVLFGASRWKSAVTELMEPKGFLALAEETGSESVRLKAYSMACKCYAELKKDADTETWCTKTIQLDETNSEALYFRGELKLQKEDYEDALRDLKKAHEANQQDRRVIDAYHRAERLLAQSKKKDYYKVLEVPRSASKKEIKKAFRKLAQQWHPDKYEGELTEEDVLKKMSSINEAYEVLSDDEKRAQFDNGVDPNEQQNQQHHHHQQHGQPFFFQQGQGGGFPGGGQQFHFNF